MREDRGSCAGRRKPGPGCPGQGERAHSPLVGTCSPLWNEGGTGCGSAQKGEECKMPGPASQTPHGRSGDAGQRVGQGQRSGRSVCSHPAPESLAPWAGKLLQAPAGALLVPTPVLREPSLTPRPARCHFLAKSPGPSHGRLSSSPASLRLPATSLASGEEHTAAPGPCFAASSAQEPLG